MDRIRYAIATAAVAIAVALAGCSKGNSDDGGSNTNKEKERMENQQLMNSIRQHIVGTWFHDGNSTDELRNTQYNDLIIKDELTFKKSEGDVLVFSADGKAHLTRHINDNLLNNTELNFDGEWAIFGVHSITDDNLWAPYGIKINYHTADSYAAERSKFIKIHFSADFKTVYLCEDTRKSTIMRYYRK